MYILQIVEMEEREKMHNFQTRFFFSKNNAEILIFVGSTVAIKHHAETDNQHENTKNFFIIY